MPSLRRRHFVKDEFSHDDTLKKTFVQIFLKSVILIKKLFGCNPRLPYENGIRRWRA